MSLPRTREGAALRAAAADLLARFPDLPGAVVGRLNHLATRYDAAEAARHRDQPVLRVDSRGRWVRRVKGNGGPGRPGVGHIARLDEDQPLNHAHVLCGGQLRGALEWGRRAVVDAAPGQEWSWCGPCLAGLSLATRRAKPAA